MGLLWKDNVRVPNNHSMAMRRLTLLEKSLNTKPELLQYVNERIATMVSKGYARALTPDELGDQHDRVWYLPVFVTMNPNKTPPKPRLVHDAAAEYQGASLNDCLLKGPDLITPLLGGIFRMRENRIAVAGDVMEMYYQVAVKKEDQHALRFLWRNGDVNNEPTTYVMQVMPFGVICASFCAQFAKNRHAETYRNEKPNVTQGIVDCMFVDDYTRSHHEVDEAKATTIEIIDALQGGFHLRNIQSNSRELLSLLPPGRISPAMTTMNLSGDGGIDAKFLGLCWNPVTDTLHYEIDSSTVPEHWPTKRELLRVVMKTFDPLGLVGHIIIRGKILLQKA